MSIILQARTRKSVARETLQPLRDTSARWLVRLIRATPAIGLQSGCASLAPAQTSSPETPPPISATCHSAQQCTLQVTVNCTHSPCTITLPDSQQNVDANGFDVVWEIVPGAGQSYVFKNPGGIFFKTPEGQNAFMCHREAQGAKFSCHGNKDGKNYKYGVELVGTPPVSVLDPWIVNR